jgi:SAM-dependent methyltransferase
MGDVRFEVGDATAMPFEGGSFDGVWLQHVNMNIEDKGKLFSEIARVLKPRGKLALHEICQGQGGDVAYPTPWASHPSISHLATTEDLKATLQGAGLKVESWEDRTGGSLEWLQAILERVRKEGMPPLGTPLLLGPEAPTIMGNMLRNLSEKRIRVVMGVGVRA